MTLRPAAPAELEDALTRAQQAVNDAIRACHDAPENTVEDGDLATSIVEDLLHTSPFYIMEDARQKWIAIVNSHIHTCEAKIATLQTALEKAEDQATIWHQEADALATRLAAAVAAIKQTDADA